MLVNLTPHKLDIHCEDDEILMIEPSGEEARISIENIPQDNIVVHGCMSVPTSLSVPGEITGLPDPKEGVLYITSLAVAQKANRKDVLSPGELIRDDENRVIGCKGLIYHKTD